MEQVNQSELRKAAEKNVLTYLAALGYDQKPKQLLLERGLTFVPLPPKEINAEDPAASSVCINVDFNNDDTNILNANFLTPISGINYDAFFYSVHTTLVSNLISSRG